ncbi:probable LRR receptor-like serine/threonine-protein kinase At1g53430 isoform X2 [Beta vulgaris subsp. vulgaris]|uniref:probable LRR receptor-like serine/threonine-protein kinase At1g53430 isoform X2 n=1 Tax=Beta vulgaris subsp. vulgaris TaxID=3555 RepID=UPI00254905BB|nr:probable LRR receptor-like serine/threonine-protein kinase At1g53430 isoform X2 [Beta vulgaris subsp. vulgaris]
MATCLINYLSFLLLALFLSSSFIEFGSIAKLIPQHEVKTLEIISQKLKNPYWNVSQTSCTDGGQSFSKTFASKEVSNVTCDCSYNSSTVCHVTVIQLKGLNLTGYIPEEFGNLVHLQEIDLTRNYISGTIPKSLSKIRLVTLAVSETRITGQIPEEIGQIATLQTLSLEDNQLGGPLPKSLGNLRNLRTLVLASNFFNGTIPETFVNLKNITELRLNGNMLSGKIPDFIGNITSLVTLDIQGTSMEGPIPSTFSLLTNLRTLAISDLKTASTPFPNLANLINLRRLVLRKCLITGHIPDHIRNLVNLTHFKCLPCRDLSYNQITGPVPELDLRYMFLTNNSFSGTLPQWLLNSKDNIDLSYNNFTGSAPSSCQQSNVNLVASYSSAKGNATNWCLLKDLPCSTKPQYHSLFINCGGGKMSFEGNEYEEDTVSDGPSIFFASGQKWAYSSTGTFQFDGDANFLAGTSDPNVTGIYQTARLAPLSLKYYGLCMRRGSYTVKLHFAEIMFTDDQNFSSNGRRIFDVAIQGNEVLKDFNIAEKAGGVGKGITMEFKDVYVNGSTLEIYLYWAGKGTTAVPKRSVYGPLISGITVTPNFKVGSGLSGGAITGIVLASCTILVLFLGILRMTGYLCGKDHENDELRRLDRGYFTLRQIKAATDDFSHRNKIGEGGFGPVYKGVLLDGKVIAVKQLSSKSKQGNREFVTEIGMISALQHPNLVKLYGYCIEGKELLLVYEYMENNCLARALFGREDQKLHLDWRTRKNICSGIARGLAYLHEESRLKIVHRDIKATNILLDRDLSAKISDFGLAKLDEEENTHISTRVAGTIGYMAPEYAMRGYLTDKADVYSFGVVVLEIVSGTSNTRYMPREEFIFLLDWAYVLLEQGNLLELVDPTLGSSYSEDEVLRLLNIALMCTNPSPTLRPKMSSVVSMIEGQLPVQARILNHSDTSNSIQSN